MPKPTMDLDHVFSYHAPTDEKLIAYQALRDQAKLFAGAILALTPPCADQAAAVRKVREALMTANAAIALDGRLDTVPVDTWADMPKVPMPIL